MGLSKTEVNLRRLLHFAPKQQNPSKLVHYVATSRELLEQLKKDSASDGLPSISKVNLNEYSERIEALAATLASMMRGFDYLERIKILELGKKKFLSRTFFKFFDGFPEVQDNGYHQFISYREIVEKEFARGDVGIIVDITLIKFCFCLDQTPNDLVQADVHESEESVCVIQPEETLPRLEPNQMNKPSSQALRRRFVSNSEGDAKVSDNSERNSLPSAKLDSSAQEHIEKHRKLQEDLTDEMVVLARQLKESSLLMSQSVQETEKILDSTERAVEHSLASTGHANTRAVEVYSRSFNTTCFTWLLIFVMSCVFVMVVLLIRVT